MNAIGDVDSAVRAAGPVVEVRDLRIELTGSHEDIVDEVGIHIRPGEVLGLVGESGSGKTTVGMALLGYCRPGGVSRASPKSGCRCEAPG